MSNRLVRKFYLFPFLPAKTTLEREKMDIGITNSLKIVEKLKRAMLGLHRQCSATAVGNFLLTLNTDYKF